MGFPQPANEHTPVTAASHRRAKWDFENERDCVVPLFKILHCFHILYQGLRGLAGPPAPFDSLPVTAPGSRCSSHQCLSSFGQWMLPLAGIFSPPSRVLAASHQVGFLLRHNLLAEGAVLGGEYLGTYPKPAFSAGLTVCSASSLFLLAFPGTALLQLPCPCSWGLVDRKQSYFAVML